jgi:hypothetical protein
MILPLLFVPLVYSISSTPDACAAPTRVPGSYECFPTTEIGIVQCCWTETDPDDPEGIELYYCQQCQYGTTNCGEKYPRGAPTPPTSGPVAPLEGGVLEQPPTATPPLFGENTNVPPTRGIEQPPMTTTPQAPPRLPGGGANVPTEDGSAEQPPTPQAGQDDNQGGGLPNIKNQENVPPGGGVAEQPEEDEGQEDSSEGAETAGPLT